MRLLLGLLGLVVGLALSVVIFGRMDHLRQFAPDQLPPWSAAIAADAGLLAGSARVAGPAGPVDLRWSRFRLEGVTPTWRGQVTAPGVSLTAQAALPWRAGHVALTEGRGTVTLAPTLGALGTALPLTLPEGTLRVDALGGAWRFADRRWERLEGRGALQGLNQGGVVIGDGTFSLRADVGGAWRLAFDVPQSTVAELSGTAEGRLDRAQATLRLALIEGPEMPADWRTLLPRVADRAGDGQWDLRLSYP